MTDENKFQRVDWTGDGWVPSDDDDEHGLPVQPRGPGLSDADLELLTLAAKAIGARAEAVEGEQWMALHFDNGRVEHGWNPLRHSDDAFTLAARLGMLVDFNSRAAMDINRTGENASDWHGGTDDDPVIATRLAITRAAAEIGKAMT